MIKTIIMCAVLAFPSWSLFRSIEANRALSGFQPGNETMLRNSGELKSMNIALLTNQTGITLNGEHVADAMLRKGINLKKIFTPEHGIRGDENYTDKDEKTGLPVVSLYGGKSKPSSSDLSGIDAVVYDIQDVGARFYTYTSTLFYLLESCIENNVKLIVCDRPIVINPDYTDGYLLSEGYSSFVGSIPVPVCYGMTCGELALYLNSEVYAGKCSIEVSKMQNYSGDMDYDSLGLPWIKPSPSMLYPSTAVCYPATCFLEGTNLSEGRGTTKPFEYFGAPWVDKQALADELNSNLLSGVVFEPVTFTPSEKISSYPPKFFNIECNGIFINVTDKRKFEAVKCGIAVLLALKKLCPEFRFNKDNFIDKLAGTDKLRKDISAGLMLKEITSGWERELDEFRDKRQKYLLYKR
jgi:uncharacterized protein YbbC (DUF1343 family)